MAKKPKKKHYTREFKVDVIRRAAASGKPMKAFAKGLGLNYSMFQRWNREFREEALKAPAPQPQQADLILPSAAASPSASAAADMPRDRRGYVRVPDGPREEFVARILAGELSAAQVAAETGATRATVDSWVRESRKKNRVAPNGRLALPPVQRTVTGPDGLLWQQRGVSAADKDAYIADLERQLSVAQRTVGRLTLRLEGLIDATIHR